MPSSLLIELLSVSRRSCGTSGSGSKGNSRGGSSSSRGVKLLVHLSGNYRKVKVFRGDALCVPSFRPIHTFRSLSNGHM